MNFIKTINSLSEIVNKYDLFLIDQWGVMHDGQSGHPHAIECIAKIFKLQKKIVIISNTSKRKKYTVDSLSSLGFLKENFHEMMTSGEMIWRALNLKSYDFIKKLGNNCFHLTHSSKEDKLEYEKGLNYNFVDNVDHADFILGCTASPKLTTFDYVPLLQKAIEKKLPFICANPDYQTIESSSNKKIICMGTVAELYKDFGGSVFILGKPSIEIYKESTKELKNISKKRILAIGDSIDHDIKGAVHFGIDSLLITTGIHSSIFDYDSPIWDKTNKNLTLFDLEPTYLCSKFHF